MQVTYIHHSCFSVEMEHIVLLFDYYKGILPRFDSSKHLYVFASHKHHDHFDMNVFDLAKDYPNITYILSKDIRMSKAYMDQNNLSEEVRQQIVYMNKYETVTLPLSNNDSPKPTSDSVTARLDSTLLVETLASTDAGVAFIISCEDKIIYHAGDLNWWSWQGETEDEYTDMTNRFKHEMNKLEGKQIDVAFVPLDPRQEDRFWWGFDHFMKITHTKTSFPMHFWMDYTVIPKLKSMNQAKEYAANVMDISEEGQQFIL